MTLVWMRPDASKVAHAFVEIDLSAGFDRIEPIAPCGKFVTSDLLPAGFWHRCTACKRARRTMR